MHLPHALLVEASSMYTLSMRHTLTIKAAEYVLTSIQNPGFIVIYLSINAMASSQALAARALTERIREM